MKTLDQQLVAIRRHLTRLHIQEAVIVTELLRRGEGRYGKCFVYTTKKTVRVESFVRRTSGLAVRVKL